MTPTLLPSRAGVLLAAGAITALAAASASAKVPASSTLIDQPAPADSLLVELPELTVSGQAAAAPPPGRATINAPAVTVRDPGSLADLGSLLPSSRVTANSRGESVLMIRGAPERHVQTFLDGIPLNLPWDERTDLSTIPITGGARIEGRRGLPTLLEGPGVLAGSVRILPPRLNGMEEQTRVKAAFGQEGEMRAGAMHQRTAGQWTVLGAGDWRTRDGWNVPDGTPGGYPPDAGDDTRFNSDLDQASLLLRASRPVAETGRLNLLATAWTVEKGVPPEMHEGPDARFWRYPERRRLLLGASLARPLGERGDWDLTGMTSLDLFRQEIDPRGPDGWDDPLVAGEDYETNLDRTGRVQLGLTRWLGERSRLSVQADARYTHHRESLVVDGPEENYAQLLGGLVVDGEFAPAPGWSLRAGAGLDHARTPESGDKEQAGSFTDPALSLRVAREVAARSEIYASASRRSRFPSLRELYSGALGKFTPNPDLVPEKQNLYEAGWTASGTGWSAGAATFVQYLADGIEKVKLADGSSFQRVNRTSIRVPGIEMNARWQPVAHLEVAAQHTVLNARVEVDGEYELPAEDRPNYLSAFEAGWRPYAGPSAHLEAIVTGPRESADSTDDGDGLRRLPAGVIWNLRLGWILERDGAEYEIHVRLANLFDQRVDDQTGLPAPGRMVSGGVSAAF